MARSRVAYQYDPQGIRNTASEATDTDLDGVFESAEQGIRTEYLVDHHNHTGSVQTIVETTMDADGNVVKRARNSRGA